MKSKRKGFYIVFEGNVGSGKTTQAKKVYEYLKNLYPKKNIVYTREPGGTEIAERIRTVVQGTKFNENMEPVCEAYLYASARAQSLRKVVSPVLKRGGIVIADRSFITSMAFQGAGRKLGIEKILKINETAIEGLIPDLVYYLDLNPRIGLERTIDKDGDKFENEKIGFFKKTQKAYKDISELKLFKQRWATINANQTIDKVFEELLANLKKRKVIKVSA